MKANSVLISHTECQFDKKRQSVQEYWAATGFKIGVISVLYLHSTNNKTSLRTHCKKNPFNFHLSFTILKMYEISETKLMNNSYKTT